jgi:hypothetical protein
MMTQNATAGPAQLRVRRAEGAGDGLAGGRSALTRQLLAELRDDQIDPIEHQQSGDAEQDVTGGNDRGARTALV